MASITGLEYAFTKAPKNMRGFVTGMFWFAQAFSAAIAQAFVGLSSDPLLVWLYTTVAIISILVRISSPPPQQSLLHSYMTTAKPLLRFMAGIGGYLRTPHMVYEQIPFANARFAQGGIGFWFNFRNLDHEEEALNALPDSVFKGSKNKDTLDIEAVEAAQAEQDKIRHAQGLDKIE